MYALKIGGWTTFLFESPTQAAQVMEALEAAQAVDTLWDGFGKCAIWYEKPTTIELVRIVPKTIWPSYETAETYKQQREALLVAPTNPTADSFNGE